MLKTMEKIQMPVLLIAGISMAALFGLSSVLEPTGIEKYQGELTPRQSDEVWKKIQVFRIADQLPSNTRTGKINDYSQDLIEADRAGIEVSTYELMQHPALQQEGKSYKEVIDTISNNLKTSPVIVEGYFIDLIKKQKLQMIKRFQGIHVTQAEVKSEFHKQFDKVLFDKATSNPYSIIYSSEPSEEVLRKFYNENQSNEKFVRPRMADIDFLKVEFSKIPTTSASKEEIRDYYNKNRYTLDRSRDFPNEPKPLFEVEEDIRKELRTKAQKEIARRLIDELEMKVLQDEDPNFKQILEQAKKEDPAFNSVQYVVDTMKEGTPLVRAVGNVDGLQNLVFDSESLFHPAQETYKLFYIFDVLRTTEEGTWTFDEVRSEVKYQYIDDYRNKLAKTKLTELMTQLQSTTDWGNIQLPKDLSYIKFSQEERPLSQNDAQIADTYGLNEVSKVEDLNRRYAVFRLLKRIPADEKDFSSKEESLRQQLFFKKITDLQSLETNGLLSPF